MSLAEQFARARQNTEAKVGSDNYAVMKRQVEELRASGILDGVVKVGEPAPDFTLPDQTGEAVRLSEVVKSGPVVLSFFRGKWCPYCNLEVAALGRAYPEIRAAGAELVVISPQLQQHSRDLIELQKLPFRILEDRGNEIAARYGLRFAFPEYLRKLYLEALKLDLSAYNGDDSWTLPIPARIVVDRSGVIRSVDADPDYTKRPEPEETLAVLRGLEAPVS